MTEEIVVKVPKDVKTALGKACFLLGITEEEAAREALYAYMPELVKRVKAVINGKELPSII